MSRFAVLVALAAALTAPPAHADAYADARQALVAAYQSSDFAAMETAARAALAARPEYPGALFNLALAQALNEDPDGSIRTLARLAARGVDFGVAEMEAFEAVRELEAWPSLAARLRALHDPVGELRVALQLEADRFVPEGIAMDPAGDIFLGSIHRGTLVNATRGGAILSERAGHWSVFGMRFHPDGTLWFASAAVPQLENAGDDAGRTGLFRFDLAAGRVTEAAELARAAHDQVLGDLVIADRDTIYTTDSLGGGVYRYRIDARRFETVVEPGVLGSPQGLVLDATGRHLYVADYIGGLYRVTLSDGAVQRLTVPGDVTDYGIDGLYRHGNTLIAIQNGIQPHRVAVFALDAEGVAVTGCRVLAANHPSFDEPTLGLVRGDTFFFVANSHWNRFDRDNALPDGLSGPTILEIGLLPSK